MDLATIGGMILGVGLIMAAILVGGELGGFVDVAGLMVVMGGTLAGCMVMFPMGQVVGAISVAMKSIKGMPPDPIKTIKQLTDISAKVRKDGPLALQSFKSPDVFLTKAVQMMVDGIDVSAMDEILTNEINNLRIRHMTGAGFFEQVGLLAPAFGMIGTLIGLVQMLQNLSNPDAIGPAMAVALLTTFYGAMIANLVCVPISKKLEIRSQEETVVLEMIVAGIASMINKENPQVMRTKLNTFLKPKIRLKG